MAAVPAFDTLKFVRSLAEAGVPAKQAEAHAHLQTQILSELITDKLATKEFVVFVTDKLATKESVALVETNLRKEIVESRAETKQLEAKVDKLAEHFTGKFNLLHWMFGIVITIAVTTIFTMLRSFF